MKQELKVRTGMEMELTKVKLLLGQDREPDDPVFQQAAALGVEVVSDGLRIVRVPVGTRHFIEEYVNHKVDTTVSSLDALKYYGRQEQWSILLLSLIHI